MQLVMVLSTYIGPGGYTRGRPDGPLKTPCDYIYSNYTSHTVNEPVKAH